MITKDDFLAEVLFIFRETFEGSPQGQSTAYLDSESGFFRTLEKLSAAQVSQYFEGTTIAAQTEHAKFYLDRICEFIEGREEKVNWEQSWLIETVSDEEWDALRDAVRKSYDNVLRCFAAVDAWDGDKMGDALAIVAHSSYHLGAIRQIFKSVK